jgi:hypothetical protein
VTPADRVTRTTNSAHAVIDAYEDVRRHFAGPLTGSMQRHGVSVLMHRGMTAWVRTWTRLGPSTPPPDPASMAEASQGSAVADSSSSRSAPVCVPQSLEMELVSMMAGMILPAVTGGEHVG